MNVSLPVPITVSAAHAAKLKTISDRQIAVQQFVQMVVAQGEARMREIVSESQATWREIEKQYGVDLKRVNYDFDGVDKIVPQAMKLV